jgi:hypothetical protein
MSDEKVKKEKKQYKKSSVLYDRFRNDEVTDEERAQDWFRKR